MTVKNKSLGFTEEVTVSSFDFSRDWKNDRRALQELDVKASPKESWYELIDDIKEYLRTDGSIAMVARDADGRVVGMNCGMPWAFCEAEDEPPKSEGGEREATEELSGLVGRVIGRDMPKAKTFYGHYIAVLPEYQRQGIATGLTRAQILEAMRQGYEICVFHSVIETKSASVTAAVMAETGAEVSRIKDYYNWYGESEYSARLLVVDLTRRQGLNALLRLGV